MEQDKRRSPRYFFFAAAELFEESSQLCIPSRVSELCQHGCYLDMMNPFPADTVLNLTIQSDEGSFQARAKTINSTPNIGAGVCFLEASPESQPVLQRGLQQAAANS
jgi:PilZ domain